MFPLQLVESNASETSNLPLKFYNVSEKLDSFFWNLTPESTDINSLKNRPISWGHQRCFCTGIAKPRDFHTKSGSSGFPWHRQVHFVNLMGFMYTADRQLFNSSTRTWIRMRDIFKHPTLFLPLKTAFSVIRHRHLKCQLLNMLCQPWALQAGEEAASRCKIRSVKSR